MSVMAMLCQQSPASVGAEACGYTSWMIRVASNWERQWAREISEAVLDGRTTILEAARELISIAHTDAIASEADRKLIILIESETDTEKIHWGRYLHQNKPNARVPTPVTLPNPSLETVQHASSARL